MQKNTERWEFTIRPTIFHWPRRLIVDPEFLQYGDQSRVTEPPTHFPMKEIAGFRYGLKSIQGYKFRIGRIYCIDIQNRAGRVIKIRLKSIYRINIKKLEEKYEQIFNAIFKNYFGTMVQNLAHDFLDGQDVELAGVSLTSHGVLFDKKIGRVSWEFVGIKEYWHYFTVFSKESSDEYRIIEYIEEWNSSLVRMLINWVLREKFPERYQV